ncbi:MAG: response regulator [Deltaproteobacteria bacterium]|nr:response regulator [Deltaproteobacteria bacterium]
MLQRLEADDPIRKEIEEIHSAGEKGAALVSQLLTFSRKKVLHPKVVDLNKILSETDLMLRRLVGGSIDVAVIRAGDLGNVRVDPTQMEQVVLNLAANARDAMPDGGKLTIETSNRDIDGIPGHGDAVEGPGKYVTLTVSDTGCGMDEKTRSRVFEPFFTTKPSGKGTGLGLSTVYGIAKQNGGHIVLESEVGKGTTFTIVLPRVEEAVVEKDVSERLAVEERRGTETLLLAEDEDLVRDLVRTILTARGYKVLEARNGKESIEIGNTYEGQIHLLITDLVMPNMNGQELSGQLTGIRPGIKTLYMSGYRQDPDNGDEGPFPDAAFVQKPFRPEELARKVRETLDG